MDDDRKPGNKVIGMESHLRMAIGIVERISALIEAENRRLFLEGQSYAMGSCDARDRKLHLYRRFDTLMRFVMRMAESDEVPDKELMKTLSQRIVRMKQVIAVNNVLLQDYIARRSRMISAIMAAIDDDGLSQEDRRAGREQLVCH